MISVAVSWRNQQRLLKVIDASPQVDGCGSRLSLALPYRIGNRGSGGKDDGGLCLGAPDWQGAEESAKQKSGQFHVTNLKNVP